MTTNMSLDEQAEAIDTLCNLLGLTMEQAEMLLNKKKSPQKLKVNIEKKKTSLKRYVHKRINKCTLCHTTSTQWYIMIENYEESGLVSTEVPEDFPSINQYQIKKTNHIVTTCKHCEENLVLLPKKELAKLFLAYINRRDYVAF